MVNGNGKNPADVLGLLREPGDVKVLVVGDVMVDRYIEGDADRLSPEAPVPVVKVRSMSEQAGGAANVAANVVDLGAQCRVVGVVGVDRQGAELIDDLRIAGIGADGIISTPDRPTTIKARVMAGRHQVARFDLEESGPLPANVRGPLHRQVRDGIEWADVVVVQDYDKGVMSPHVIAEVSAGCRRPWKPWIVDPKSRIDQYMEATCLKPNLRELHALLPGVDPYDPRQMEEARKRLGCLSLVVTMGPDGIAVASGISHQVVPAMARSVYDVSGAGDTVAATLAVVTGAGGDVFQAVTLANMAAGVVVGKAGCGTVTLQEIVDTAVPS